MVEAIGNEVAVALELEALVAVGTAQRRFEPGLHHALAGRVETALVVAPTGVGLLGGEEPVVQAYLGGKGIGRGHPGDHAFDLDGIRPRRAALGIGHEFGLDLHDLS